MIRDIKISKVIFEIYSDNDMNSKGTSISSVSLFFFINNIEL